MALIAFGSVAAATATGAQPQSTDALRAPDVHRTPLPAQYLDENRMFLCGPGITISPGGRLWVAFMTGGISEDPDNCTVVVTSGDGGESWSGPVLAVDIDGPIRTNDPGLWTSPEGEVMLGWGQVYDFWDGRGGYWVMSAKDPDNADTDWSEPVRLSDGYLKNKPLFTKDGRWLFPIEHMGPRGKAGRMGREALDPAYHFPRADLNHANVFVSEDKGRSLRYLSQAQIPAEAKTYQEHMIVEKNDGTLWMLARTRYGMGEAFSRDGGKTWTQMQPAEGIKGPSARFFFARLHSGNLLLIKNGEHIDQPSKRTHMTAYLSEDDGKSWPYKLVLDERSVSYPDATQGADGQIYIVHDFERQRAKEVVFHRITEDDIRAGKLVSSGSKLGGIANKATARTLKPEEYDRLKNRGVPAES